MHAAKDLRLDLTQSWLIGDKTSDLECGRNAGVRSILVLTGDGSLADPSAAEFVAEDIGAAVEFILCPQ